MLHIAVCRLLGLEDLVPAHLLIQQRDWYAANVMQKYGLPLNSRKTYTKDDWMTFLAATYFTNDSTTNAVHLYTVAELACPLVVVFVWGCVCACLHACVSECLCVPRWSCVTPCMRMCSGCPPSCSCSATPAPSSFSTLLFDGLFRFANETTTREALSDWTETVSPEAVGFTNRPV